MRISVIVPALNEARRIAGCLDGLQAMRKRGVEVIVVDGGSSDGTVEAARLLADSVIDSPRGRAAQMNAGARHAHGDILWFVHADSGVPPEADSAICSVIGAGACWGRFDVRIDGHSRWLGLVARLMNARSRLTGIATGDQGIFAARGPFWEAGGFPPIPLMEDVALSSTLRKRSRPGVAPGLITTSGRKWDSEGVWRTIILMWRLRLLYFFGADPALLARIYYTSPDEGKAQNTDDGVLDRDAGRR